MYLSRVGVTNSVGVAARAFLSLYEVQLSHLSCACPSGLFRETKRSALVNRLAKVPDWQPSLSTTLLADRLLLRTSTSLNIIITSSRYSCNGC